MTVSAVYAGVVTHKRFRPRVHTLKYGIFQIYLDLDEAEALSDGSLVFGFNKTRLLSFFERDHGDGSDAPLKAQIEARVAAEGFDIGGPVRVMGLPRVLGFVFNPITLYFCHRPDGSLSAMVYEVNNTFGDRTTYVLPASDQPVMEHGARKHMHVSPFMEMDYDYDFMLHEPGDRFLLGIHVRRADTLWLSAAFAADRSPFTDRALLAAWISHPLLTLKVVAGIHWEALKISLKGIGLKPKPHGKMRFGDYARAIKGSTSDSRALISPQQE